MNYQLNFPISQDFTCVVCHDPISTNDKAVAHANGGERHPLHESCAKACAAFSSNCPTCKVNLNLNSLNPTYTFKEWCIKEGKMVVVDVIKGVLLASTLATINYTIFGKPNIMLIDLSTATSLSIMYGRNGVEITAIVHLCALAAGLYTLSTLQPSLGDLSRLPAMAVIFVTSVVVGGLINRNISYLTPILPNHRLIS